MLNRIKRFIKKDKINDYSLIRDFNNKKFPYLYSQYNILLTLAKNHKVVFEKAVNERCIIHIDDISLHIQTAEEIYILNEIFHNGCYNFITNKDFIIVDIGMNVGIASLFFATKSYVKKIYAYEPFLPTFNQAIFNFSLNPHYQIKIISNNFGLGKRNEKFEVDYYPEWKGSMNTKRLPNYAKYINQRRKQKEKVEINDITPVINKIVEDNEYSNLMVKIDCEGAEYDIVDSLSDSTLLDKIDVLILEWHVQGPKNLESILSKFNFQIISCNPFSEGTGIIYAIKS